MFLKILMKEVGDENEKNECRLKNNCSSSKKNNAKYKLYVFRAMFVSIQTFCVSLIIFSIISSMFNISVLKILTSFNLENPKETRHNVGKIHMVKELELKDLSKHAQDPKTMPGMRYSALDYQCQVCFFLIQYEGKA